jgi:hypothetical protein
MSTTDIGNVYKNKNTLPISVVDIVFTHFME